MAETDDLGAQESPTPTPTPTPTEEPTNMADNDDEPKFTELSLEDKLANLQEVVASCQGVVADLQNEKHDLKLALQRSHADFVNMQKRAKKDEELARHHATRSFLEDLIPILDNIRYSLMALEAQNADAAILDPVIMLNDSFVKILIKHKVEQILPEPGDAFDPEYHQAVSVILGKSPGETIAHISRPGYAIAGQVFRPAEVVVQKG